MWGKFAQSQAKSQVTESLYEVKTARTQQTTELMQVFVVVVMKVMHAGMFALELKHVTPCTHAKEHMSLRSYAGTPTDHQALHRHGSSLQRQRQPPSDAVAGNQRDGWSEECIAFSINLKDLSVFGEVYTKYILL